MTGSTVSPGFLIAWFTRATERARVLRVLLRVLPRSYPEAAFCALSRHGSGSALNLRFRRVRSIAFMLATYGLVKFGACDGR